MTADRPETTERIALLESLIGRPQLLGRQEAWREACQVVDRDTGIDPGLVIDNILAALARLAGEA